LQPTLIDGSFWRLRIKSTVWPQTFGIELLSAEILSAEQFSV
jgi:hypothetical protein